MRGVAWTLLPEGGGDRVLMPILARVVSEHGRTGSRPVLAQFADPAASRVPRKALAERIHWARATFPCDVLFVQRDTEARPREHWERRIESAARSAGAECVPVVPVRMSEAWLLIDEVAIRAAAGNPDGTVPLALPRLRDLESEPDPKRRLDACLIAAAEIAGRRLQRLRADLPHRRLRVAQQLEDLAPLRRLPVFVALERSAHAALDRL